MKKILFFVAGGTPQVITETLYGLAISPEESKRWIPDEIHVLSTSFGIEKVQQQIIDKHRINQMFEEYGMSALSIPKEQIYTHTFVDNQGKVLKDLTTEDDNTSAANQICELVSTFTAHEDKQLHFSLAGGRKTMSYYAGYAMSFYGRMTDRLSHVGVSPEFENNPNFFYPAKEPKTRFVDDRQAKNQLDTYNAQVWLTQVPFVSLRTLLFGKTLQVTQQPFEKSIAIINACLEPLSVVIKVWENIVEVNQLSCKLSPQEFAFFMMFVKSSFDNKGIKCPSRDEVVQKEFEDIYSSYWSGDDLDNHSISKKNFEHIKSAINTRFVECFGQFLTTKVIMIQDKRGAPFYWRVTPEETTIIES